MGDGGIGSKKNENVITSLTPCLGSLSHLHVLTPPSPCAYNDIDNMIIGNKISNGLRRILPRTFFCTLLCLFYFRFVLIYYCMKLLKMLIY